MKKNTGSGRKVILIQFFALISNLESELENFARVFFNWFLKIFNIFDARSQVNYSIFFYFYGWSLNKIWFRAKKYSCKFFLKSIFKKIKKWYFIIMLSSPKIDTSCISLTINFYENLHEYFFARNWFLLRIRPKKIKIKFIVNPLWTIEILKCHLKKTRGKFSSFDSRFEISAKNWIRITFRPDPVFFFNF